MWTNNFVKVLAKNVKTSLGFNVETVLNTKVAKNEAIVAGTKTKISYDEKGLVILGENATTDDIDDVINKRYCTDVEKLSIQAVSFQIKVQPDTSVVTVGDGKTRFVIPPHCNNLNLAACCVDVVSNTSTSPLSFQIHNETTGNDILSSNIIIDANHYSSCTSSIEYDISSEYSTVNTSNILRLDCDSAGDGLAQGCILYLKFN